MPADLEPEAPRTDRVVVDDDVALRWWAAHFAVPVERVRQAVLAVGPMPTAVAYFLQQSGQARVGRMKPRPEKPRVRERRRSKSRSGTT